MPRLEEKKILEELLYASRKSKKSFDLKSIKALQLSAVKKKKLKKMSVIDPRIFQSITKSITRFCLKYFHNFIIKYGEGYLRCLKLDGRIIN